MARIDLKTSQIGSFGTGDLQLQNGVAMDATLRLVTDAVNTASPLRLSTTNVTSYGGGAITSNTAYGDGALDSNTTGSDSAAFGASALTGNTTGASNTGVGHDALFTNSTGSFNTALGKHANRFNSTGTGNTGLGALALRLNSTGTGNTGVGYLSLENNTNSNNTALGYRSLRANTSGSQNTGVAVDALLDNTTGIGNTAVGYSTGLGITTGSYNTILGANVTGLSATLANNIILADGQGNRRINVDSTGNVGIGTTTPLTKLHVAQDVSYSPSQSGQLYVSGATNTGKRLMLGYDTTSNYGFIEGVNFGVAYSPIILNPTQGNVGIGTTAPPSKLSILGSQAGASPTALLRVGNNGAGYMAKIILTDETTADGQIVFQGSALGSSSQYIGLGISAVDVVKITGDNYLRMSSGSGGIQFNGDTAAANALDDYEEGTWTANVTASVTAPTGVTYAYRGGAYTKIGNRVIANCGFYISSVGTGGLGNLQISGLPFTTANYGSYQEPSVKTQGGGWLVPSLAYSAYVYTIGNSNILEFRDGSNVDSPIPYAQLLVGTYLGLTIIYNV